MPPSPDSVTGGNEERIGLIAYYTVLAGCDSGIPAFAAGTENRREYRHLLGIDGSCLTTFALSPHGRKLDRLFQALTPGQLVSDMPSVRFGMELASQLRALFIKYATAPGSMCS